jgi:hypothetical protein
MVKTKKIVKEHEYPLTKGEIKYKIIMNPDKNKYNEITNKIRENNFFCITAKEKLPETRCFCQEFLSLDKENVYCSCNRYFKIARTDEEIKKYITAKAIVGKNEKKILQEKITDENSNSVEQLSEDD